MVWDPTAWAMDGGAPNPVPIARALAFAATKGAEGVIAPLDCKVTALATPGGSVRVLPGVATVRNRVAGGASETYIARNPTEDTVAVPATDATGARSHLVAVVVEDPYAAGSGFAKPSDPNTVVAVRTRVIPNVPAGTTRLQDVNGYASRTGYALARIDMPASTGAVTAAMIVDLRALALARTERFLSVDVAQGGRLTSTADVQWPSNTRSPLVPAWATHVTGKVAVHQAEISGGKGYASVRVALGPTGSALNSAETFLDFDTPPGGFERVGVTVLIADRIPEAWRGSRQLLQVIGKRLNPASDPGVFAAKAGTQIEWDLQFEERIA